MKLLININDIIEQKQLDFKQSNFDDLIANYAFLSIIKKEKIDEKVKQAIFDKLKEKNIAKSKFAIGNWKLSINPSYEYDEVETVVKFDNELYNKEHKKTWEINLIVSDEQIDNLKKLAIENNWSFNAIPKNITANDLTEEEKKKYITIEKNIVKKEKKGVIRLDKNKL